MAEADLHSLLKRQIKRHLGDSPSLPENWEGFVRAVNDAYREFDHDRAMLERSLDLTSQELLGANSAMRAVYERLIESSVDGIFAFDRNFRFTVWNPEMERIAGVSRVHALGKTHCDLFPTLRHNAEQQFFADALAGKTALAAEMQFIHTRDAARFFEGYFSPLLSERGEIVGGLAIVRDISARKLAEAETQHRANEFAALYEIINDLAGEYDVPKLLNTIIDRATALLSAPGAGVYLYDADKGDLELAVGKGFRIAVGTRLKIGEGMAGRVAQSRQPLILDDYHAWEYRSPQYADFDFAAVAEVPMVFRGDLVGVLAVTEFSATTRKFSEADVRLLSLFAGNVASAVHNARLFDETGRRLAQLEAVNQLSTRLRETQTLEEMLPIILQEIQTFLDATATSIWLYDPIQDELLQAGQRSFPRIETGLKRTQGIAGKVFSTGEMHLSRNFKADPLTSEAMRSVVPDQLGGVCVPVRAAHQIIGALFVSVQQPREISARETDPLMILAEIAGNAIHRARLNAQTQQRLQHLTVLRTIDTAISSSLDLNVTLNVMLDQMTGELGMAAADVLLLDAHTHALEFAAGRGFRNPVSRRPRARLGEGHAGRAALERRVVNIPDLRVRAEAGKNDLPFGDEGFIAYYAAPLFVKGQVKGVLEIFQRAPFKFDAEWNDFLETLARQAAIAIENTDLFNDLQRSALELGMAYDTTLEGWSKALDLRDRETEGHTQRVTEITMQLAREMNVASTELVNIRRGAILHDIGKMGVPDSILLKPGPLTDEEWTAMRKHPQYAVDMLSAITYLRPALEIPFSHHEKWDGTGYPRGLAGEAIPLSARIFAVADVWDALRSDRPYRKGWDKTRVREHIRELAGTHFDPRVVQIFLNLDLEQAGTR